MRSQTAMHWLCRTAAAAALAAASLLAAPMAGHAQEVVALVDGEPITALDIEHRMKFLQMSTQKPSTKKEALDSLIDEILEVHEAKRFNITVPDSEVDSSFATVAVRMGADADKLKEMLTKGGSSVGTFKHRLRAQLAWNALVRGRYKSSLEIADTDVEAALDLHKSPDKDKNEVGYEYVLRPILLLVPRGSPDSAFEARKRDVAELAAGFGEEIDRAGERVGKLAELVAGGKSLAGDLVDAVVETHAGAIGRRARRNAYDDHAARLGVVCAPG